MPEGAETSGDAPTARRAFRSRAAGVAAAALLLVTGVVVVRSQAAEPQLAPLAQRVKVGAYVHLQDRPYADPVATGDLEQLEARIGQRLDVVHYFWDWGRPFGDAVTDNVTSRELMLSWKPTGDVVRGIVAGDHDRYVEEFAAAAARWGQPVYLRFGHEMNGEWMSYSAGADGGPDAQAFTDAWRRLSRIFDARGATNVQLVWSPNETDVPDEDGNRMEDYWPGEQYVDIAGFDAYNWGEQQPRRGDGDERSFEKIVEGPYDRISDLSDKPIWLCEFGTSGRGSGEWFEDMFAVTRFERLEALVYFSEADDRDVQRDWRIDATDEGVEGWRRGWSASSDTRSDTSSDTDTMTREGTSS